MGRILIVEDDVDSREALGTIVENWGHEVEEAFDGLTGLSYVEEFEPDVVILDLGLPGIDGVEVVELLRMMDRDRPFVIALTGWTRPHDREAALRAGCSVVLTKPTDLGQLRLTIDHAVVHTDPATGTNRSGQ